MSTRSVRYSTFNRSVRKGNLASTDRDALAFLEAAQIYNTNQQRAIVNLVRSLKRVGLWSKMKAIYPFVGGTASAHKWNLKDPRDADAAFRLTFSGGWTHSANGADPNGTSAYADTYLANNVMGQNSLHFTYYSRESTKGLFVDIGARNNLASPFPASFMFLQFTDDKLYGNVNQNNNASTFSAAVTDSQGLFIAIRNNSTSTKYIRNTTTVGIETVNSVAPSDRNFYLGALNTDNSATLYANRQCAFATIGDGLTDTDATNLYNIVDLYQKRLGRAV